MTYYSDPHVTLHRGDALDVLRTLPSGSVDCAVTSPPYFGLRDYDRATLYGGAHFQAVMARQRHERAVLIAAWREGRL